MKALVLDSITLTLIIISSTYVGYITQLHMRERTGLPCVPVVVTDKEQYRVGETIHTNLRYVNPNPHSVSFTPPTKVFIQCHKWPDSTDPKDVPIEESLGSAKTCWNIVEGVVVGPNEGFDVISCEFVATRAGTFIVQLEHTMKELEVLG
jgi:hypothetical protein